MRIGWIFGLVVGLQTDLDISNTTDTTNSNTVNLFRTTTGSGEVILDEARTEIKVIKTVSLLRMFQGADLSDGAYIRSLNEEMPLTKVSQESFFYQYIDHKNPELGTFKQKFLINNRYYKPGGPVLLQISSGTKIVPEMLFVGSIIDLAQSLNAMILGLEQRYYGDSNPYPDLSTDNLKYLTLEQSVDDIGRFVERVNLGVLLQGRPRWVVVGGSYGGNLAAWSRLKYPDLIYAGWISSAPLQAIEVFPQYDLRVGLSLEANCRKEVVQTIQKLDRHLFYNNTMSYQSEFLCPDLSPGDFVWGLAEVLGYLAQYSLPQRPPEIKDICKELQVDDKILGMASFYREFFTKFGMNCSQFSGHAEMMSIIPSSDAAIARQNSYVMCREMGHFQVSPATHFRFRSRFITRDTIFKRFCTDPFGITAPPAVAETNAAFGGFNINATRLVFTTGDLDPWFFLTQHDETLSTPDRPIYVIRGGRHNSDFNDPGIKGEPPSLADVRVKVFSHIKHWLAIRE